MCVHETRQNRYVAEILDGTPSDVIKVADSRNPIAVDGDDAAFDGRAVHRENPGSAVASH